MNSRFPRNLFLAAATIVAASSAQAADIIWDGSTSAVWETTTNWSGDNVPNALGERAVFDGAGINNSTVTFTTAVNSVAFDGILVTGGQTSGLTLNNSAATTNNFRIGVGITIESGAGAFNFATGGGGGLTQLIIDSAVTLRNDSGNLATIGTNVELETTTSIAGTTTFDGSGNWLVNALITNGGGTAPTHSLIKAGAGTTTLTRANNFTGTTTINAGTLLVNNTTGSGTSTGTVAVNAGILGGTGTISGAVNVANLATIRGGTGAAASGALTISGNVTLASGSVIELALGSGGTHSSLNFNGTTDSFQTNQLFSFIDLGMEAGTYTGLITGAGAVDATGWNFTASGWQYDFTNNAGSINLTLTAVPEPSTYGLIGAGALAAVAFVRRRRKLAGKAA